MLFRNGGLILLYFDDLSKFNGNNLVKSFVEDFRRDLLPKYLSNNNAYEGQHQVLFREGQLNGIENHIVINFQKQIIDTAHNYLLAKPITYKSKCNEDDVELVNTDEFIKRLGEIFDKNDEHFHTSSVLKHTSILGDGYEYWYIDTAGEIKVMEIPAFEGMAIYSAKTRELEAFLRVYEVEEIGADGSSSKYHNIEFYDDTEITYYTYRDGVVYLDTSMAENPKPHYMGEVPIVHFANNKQITKEFGQSDLKDVETMIANYEEVVSDLADTIQYHASPYYVLENAMMDTEQMEEVHKSKMFMLPEEAKLSYLTWQQDINAIQFHLDLLKKNILEVSNTPDLSADANTNLSGVAIKMKFAGADLKANNKEIEYKKGLKKRIRLIAKLLNLLENTAYTASKVDILFNRNIPQNLNEIADTISKFNGIVSKETLLAQVPFVDDVEAERLRLEAENSSSMNLEGMFPTFQEENEDIEEDIDPNQFKPQNSPTEDDLI